MKQKPKPSPITKMTIKEAFLKHQAAKKAELEKIKLKQKQAELKGFSRAFKTGLSFDGLE